ncbi:hypothetical protein E2C01_036723 [Portunus trituberculatus]|uniref:Uncharacterized protein n=1 Tax=Portunus trituberculatus TaxID=210409 RepID=A0A5B7FCQ7_PORTR|nr:hypothetical protein [Portunus trituberculatus]
MARNLKGRQSNVCSGSVEVLRKWRVMAAEDSKIKRDSCKWITLASSELDVTLVWLDTSVEQSLWQERLRVMKEHCSRLNYANCQTDPRVLSHSVAKRLIEWC